MECWKKDTKQIESMVPYDFFSQLFCVSSEKYTLLFQVLM